MHERPGEEMKASTDGMKREEGKEREKERNPTTHNKTQLRSWITSFSLHASSRKTCTPMETSEAAAPASAPTA